MKNTTILTFTLICFFGCNSAPKSEEKAMETTEHSSEPDKIQVIETTPDEIDGCSCYASRNKDEFEKREYIYMDDYGDIAFMQINGRIERLKLTKSDTLTSADHSKETWANEDFEVTLEKHETGQIEETWQHKGKLTLKPRAGDVIEMEIVGECGC